jgi:hypothetical protein
VTLQQTDIKKKKEEEEESGAKQWRHRHHAGQLLLLPALVLDEIEPRRTTIHVRQHCRGKYLELPNDVWNIPHRIPRSLVWLSTSRAQHNQIHFYTATSSDISQPIVSLQNKSSTKNRFSELSLI